MTTYIKNTKGSIKWFGQKPKIHGLYYFASFDCDQRWIYQKITQDILYINI